MRNLRFLNPVNAATGWRRQLQNAIRSLADIEACLGSSPANLDSAGQAAEAYPVCITPYYLSLARGTSLNDPILRQCIPCAEELLGYPEASPDPFHEDEHSPVPNLIQRYKDRALILANTSCAVLCRHCFRKRHWADTEGSPSDTDLTRIAGYLREHPEIREVLVSGGDPLMLEDLDIQRILEVLRGIPTVRVIRIATRLPATLPQRITEGLCGILAAHHPVWVAAHFNHPWELTDASAAACARLADAGVPVVSQTVLLRGVNDDAAILRELFTGLLEMRVKPYYLFHGDPATGTMHFRVPMERGRELVRELRETTSGLAIPAYAADEPGKAAKTRLA